MSTISGHAWVGHGFGQPVEVLRWEERIWSAGDDTLLVEVLAAGVGLPDLLMTGGSYPLVRTPPTTPGQEVCGRVIVAPPGSRFAVGDRVMGTTLFLEGHGGFATHTLLRERSAWPAPQSFSDAEAAGFSIPFRTAHAALVVRAGLRSGERVLVLGAAGSTGSAAVVLAKALGGYVVAMAGSDERREFCAGLGADAVIDRNEGALRSAVDDLTGGQGFDVVVDPVGGRMGSAAARRTLARYGRFAAVGFAGGSWASVDAADLVRRNASVVGVLAAGFTSEEDRRHESELVDLVEAGHLRPPIGAIHPMREVPVALASLAQGAAPGKLVISHSDL